MELHNDPHIRRHRSAADRSSGCVRADHHDTSCYVAARGGAVHGIGCHEVLQQHAGSDACQHIGLNVKNNANETIGEINELILDKDGKVAAVVIGVGGFLGIGQHEVAIDYKSLNVKYDPNAMTDAGATTVTVDATKDSLKAAPLHR